VKSRIDIPEAQATLDRDKQNLITDRSNCHLGNVDFVMLNQLVMTLYFFVTINSIVYHYATIKMIWLFHNGN
jgi:hypothetical protein